jgi:hypothetical protein
VTAADFLREPATTVEAVAGSTSHPAALCAAGLGTLQSLLLRSSAAPRRTCRRPRRAGDGHRLSPAACNNLLPRRPHLTSSLHQQHVIWVRAGSLEDPALVVLALVVLNPALVAEDCTTSAGSSKEPALRGYCSEPEDFRLAAVASTPHHHRRHAAGSLTLAVQGAGLPGGDTDVAPRHLSPTNLATVSAPLVSPPTRTPRVCTRAARLVVPQGRSSSCGPMRWP